VKKITEYNKLVLQKITIKNYRRFYGENELLFSNDSNRTVTIIQGDMGKGKTTILDAINWCLYNEESERTQKKDNEEPIINSNAYKVLKKDETDETLVEITFSDDIGPYITIERKIEFTKENDMETELHYVKQVMGKIPKGISIKTKVNLIERKRDTSLGGPIIYQDPIHDETKIDNKVEEFFPKSLSMFFLFDAETLDKFFEIKNNLVKKGIENITGLPILQDIKNIFKKIKTEQSQTHQLDPILQTKIDEIEICNKNIQSFNEKLESFENELEQNNLEIQGMEFKLDKIGGEKYAEMKGEQNLLDEQIKTNKGAINNVGILLKEKVSKSLPTMLLKGTLEQAEKLFQIDEDNGELPAPVNPKTLKDMIHTKNCICERELQPKMLERFEKMLRLSTDSALVRNIGTGRTIISNLLQTYAADLVQISMDQDRVQRSDLQDELNDKQKQRQRIEDQIGEVSEKEVNELRASIKNIRNIKNAELNRDVGGMKTKLDTANKKLETLENEKEELQKKKTNLINEYRKQKIARFVEKEAERLRNELIEDIRLEAEKQTSKYFLDLVNPEDFKSVSIKADYTTRPVGHDGVAAGYSVGQGIAMALAFISSLRDITAKKYFLLMDSGYHSVSAPERLLLVRGFAKYLKGTQIICLVQGQEYTSTSKKDISGQTVGTVQDELKKLNILDREYILKEVPVKQPDLKTYAKVELHKDYRSTN